ncbi:hypothetical protein BGX30_007344, partial [Mortierella sp. GBA39]
PSTATTLPEQPTVTATTTVDTTTAPAAVSPTTTATPAAVEKRQAAPSILEAGPLDHSPEQIKAWLKAVFNELAVSRGLAAPF